jgi:hypothetical protein
MAASEKDSVQDEQIKVLRESMEAFRKEQKEGFEKLNDRMTSFELAHQGHEFRISAIEDIVKEKKERDKTIRMSKPMLWLSIIGTVIAAAGVAAAFIAIYTK